jgi:hypothetical protein
MTKPKPRQPREVAAAELGLRAGDSVIVLLKSSQIMILRSPISVSDWDSGAADDSSPPDSLKFNYFIFDLSRFDLTLETVLN